MSSADAAGMQSSATPAAKRKRFSYESYACNDECLRQMASQALQNFFGFADFKSDQQAAAVLAVLQRRDVVVSVPTGGGKSLCYQLPAVLHAGVSVVVSPLLSLIQDQLVHLAAKGICAASLNSTLPAAARLELNTDLCSAQPRTKLLFVTPEQIATTSFQIILQDLYKQGLLSLLAVDEAHCVSSWGHEFRRDYRKLGAFKRSFPSVPVLALTATATASVRRDIIEQLVLQCPVVVQASCYRPNLVYDVVFADDLPPNLTLLNDLCDYVRNLPLCGAPLCGIVYAHKRETCDTVATELRTQGFRAAAYHAGLNPSAREHVQRSWMQGQIEIVVATVSFGMGIDKAGVRFGCRVFCACVCGLFHNCLSDVILVFPPADPCWRAVGLWCITTWPPVWRPAIKRVGVLAVMASLHFAVSTTHCQIVTCMSISWVRMGRLHHSVKPPSPLWSRTVKQPHAAAKPHLPPTLAKRNYCNAESVIYAQILVVCLARLRLLP